jgi:hypothetical protein
MKKSNAAILTALIIGMSFSVKAQDTLWVNSPRDFSCPKTVLIGQALILKKSKQAGSELAVKGPDGKLRILVIGMPEPEMKTLMSTEALSAATEIKMNTKTLYAAAWEVNAKPVKVFAKAGIYQFMLSGNLESDEGGYRCQVKAVV